MEKYESICTVGEGSYGVVLKCKDKTNGSIVAIKKFLETDTDKAVKKIATREIKILKTLRHENLVNLIEVFRRNRRIYLVFEFIEQNLLEEIERSKVGLGEVKTKEIMYQVVRGVDFMHSNNIIHRDIKPENVLINKNGLVKLCDFGFARHIALPTETHTDYVATRWYRSPELLVGDTKYGKPVDVWSIGVLTYEVLTSRPLFPGESDLDQLYLIMSSLGDITESMKACFQNNQFYLNVKLPRIKNFVPLQNRLRRNSANLTKFILDSLVIDPQKRPSTVQLLEHELFTSNHWVEDFLVKLRKLVSIHETSIYRASHQHHRFSRMAQTRQQQQLQPPPSINENTPPPPPQSHQQTSLMMSQQQPIGGIMIIDNTLSTGGGGVLSKNGNTIINKASNESLNQHENTYHYYNSYQQSQQQPQSQQLTQQQAPMMNKVNITFNNLNTESKASFTSNLTNESNMIIKNKANQKMLSDSYGMIKQQQQQQQQQQQYSNRDQEMLTNKPTKNFLPKIDRKTPESPKLEFQQTNGLKTTTLNQASNTNMYKSQSQQIQSQQQQQQQQQQQAQANLKAAGYYHHHLHNHHYNHQLKPAPQSKVSSNSVEFANNGDTGTMTTTTTTASTTGTAATTSNLNLTSSTTTMVNEQASQYPNNNNNNTTSSSSVMMLNRSNTNNTILTPTNLSENGNVGGNVYIIDEANYRISNNNNNNNNNVSSNKKPITNNSSNISISEAYSPSGISKSQQQQQQQLREVKFNNASTSNVNSLRLPQVKSIEMYPKPKNFLYENKKALLQITHKK